MYLDFYDLRELPFELSPNPRYLLLTPRQREALANLQYGIAARKSLTLLIGEAGTGKTTLVNAALGSDACRDASIVQLANPSLTRDEFIEFLARAFELSTEARTSKAALLVELEALLLDRRARGGTTALVIDEAQCLSRGLLEEIRLLSNIETTGEKLLPLVLAGQPEFADVLDMPSLRQLKQRVALRCTLGLLNAAETAAYIAGRIRIAGGDVAAMFTRDAIEAVFAGSGGIPRTISVICDNALVTGFALGVKPVGVDVIRDVCADFELKKPRVPAPAVRSGVPARDARDQAPPLETVKPAPAGDWDRPLFTSFEKKRRFSFF